MESAKILIVEDEKGINEIEKKYLEKEGFDVEQAFDGTKADKLLDKNEYDLVILDLMLPGMSGEKLMQKIRSSSDTAVIMVTAKVEEDDIIDGLKLGADDYITKPFSPRELVARVQAMLRRPRRPTHPPAAHAAREVGLLRIDAGGRDAWLGDEPVALTRTEFDILDALSANPNLALSRRQIIDEVWGPGWVGDEHVVDVHVANLRKKLDDPPAEPRYILTVRGVGYRMGQG